MSLIKCSECGKKYSDNALSCPECSCPTSVVINNQKKSFYVEHLKENANLLNTLNDGKEKEKKLCECVSLLSKIKDEKVKIDFDNSLKSVKNLLKKIDNIDKEYLIELGISNYEEIISFISKRLLIFELIDIQKKHNKELKVSIRLDDDIIERHVESEVEYYYKNKKKSKNGVLYKKREILAKEFNSKTYFHSLREKGLVVKNITTLGEELFIYDEKLIEDCKIANKICEMYINQYILKYSIYCFLKEKKEATFIEISDFIENELEYIIPEAKNKEIKSYINILLILIKCYYKCDEKKKLIIYEENEENEKEYLSRYKLYEKIFNFICQYLNENSLLNLNVDEYKKLDSEYEKELDGIDYKRMLMLCRVLYGNGILKSDETYLHFENDSQFLDKIKVIIKKIVLKKEEITLKKLEKEVFKKMKDKSHLNLYLSKQIPNCISMLEFDKSLIMYEKNDEFFVSIFSEEIERKKEEKKLEEIERLQREQEKRKNFFTNPQILCKEIKLFSLLLSKKKLYLEYASGASYFELEKLFNELANNYNEYARAILNMPMQQYKPMSSSTAEILGTIVGGVSAGILASERAEKKMAEYKESQKNYFSRKSSMDIAREKTEKNYYMIENIIYENINIRKDWIQTRDECIRNSKSIKKVNGGCYVATCVYGSYDCSQVWTLRRFRDIYLAEKWYGRLFIKIYYAISPTIVKFFGETRWFRKFCKGKLDKMVMKLQKIGYEATPYQDKDWK